MEQEVHSIRTLWMIALAFVVGLLGGLGAMLLRALIAVSHNLFFFGKFSFYYDVNSYTDPSRWGWGVIFVPVIGSIIVTFLITTFASEARGGGVPDVLNAIYYRKGKIRFVVAWVTAISSAVSLGSGGSLGREGPTIQIGASLASVLGQLIKMPTRQRNILIAAGAGACVAATFNTPIGGLAFAVEIMLVSINATSVALVAIATVTATHVARMFYGLDPTFDVPSIWGFGGYEISLQLLLWFIPFGILAGAVSAVFIHSIYWFEDQFDRIFKNPYIRHMSGMLLLGVIMYLFMRVTGHYYIDGIGYAVILEILKDVLTNPLLLFALFLAKLLCTNLTFGSGASGGIFSPALFLGATMGACVGKLVAFFFPTIGAHPALFAIAGMAAIVSGSTGAVITAIAIVFEQTRDYHAILPVMLSAGLAYAVRVWITKDSIYTLKLSRHGFTLPRGLQADVESMRNVLDVMEKSFQVISMADIESWINKLKIPDAPLYAIVEKSGEVVGVIKHELHYLLNDSVVEESIDRGFLTVSGKISWPALLRRMQRHHVDSVLVMKSITSKSANDVLGVITTREIAAIAKETAELIS